MEHTTDRLFVGIGSRRYRMERPWGSMPPGSTLGQVSHVGVDSRDRVYAVLRRDAVADPVPADPIVVFDAQGEFVGSWGKEWIADAHGIYGDSRGNLFVAELQPSRIAKLTLQS